MILQVIVLIVWFFSAVLSFHRFYYVTTMEHQLDQDEETEVFCAMDMTNFNHKMTDVVTFFLLFFLPLIAITILCTKAALAALAVSPRAGATMDAGFGRKHGTQCSNCTAGGTTKVFTCKTPE